MTLTVWVFTISGLLLLALTVLEVAALRSSERPAYLRVLSYGSNSLERVWLWMSDGVEKIGLSITSATIGTVEWLISHGIRTLFDVFRNIFIRIARMARSRGVIKKRGAASLFLKQVSQHKREHPGEIEDHVLGDTH